ncbi:MAG: 4-(cytidine 5'-diphospho)-2-C-methyl-D-erythritol kinase [bacterium]|nr:4-(cytidine 5'-diphospho)-2-C-methyl-D-erythritol kinase [bacterium]
MKLSLPSFAKINLHLRVLGKRYDGFHDLFTVFQTISLADDITFELADASELVCDDPRVPTDATNLIVRAARALNPKGTARISLVKRIPMGGGLGGGSANAATALIGLNRLWELGLSTNQLASIGAEIGSDVPFFLSGGTALGMRRGTEIEDFPDFEAGPMVLITPDGHVSTAGAYASLHAQNLTNAELNRILRVCRSEAESPDFLRSALINDFEPAVFADFPEIGRAKRKLLEFGASRALMSGSGASVFGIFDKEETRQTALKALDDEVNWRRFAVAAISRSEYREKMGIAGQDL